MPPGSCRDTFPTVFTPSSHRQVGWGCAGAGPLMALGIRLAKARQPRQQPELHALQMPQGKGPGTSGQSPGVAGGSAASGASPSRSLPMMASRGRLASTFPGPGMWQGKFRTQELLGRRQSHSLQTTALWSTVRGSQSLLWGRGEQTLQAHRAGASDC